MYTAINWAIDLGLYAAVCALTCALWWMLGRRAESAVVLPTGGRAPRSDNQAAWAGASRT